MLLSFPVGWNDSYKIIIRCWISLFLALQLYILLMFRYTYNGEIDIDRVTTTYSGTTNSIHCFA